jgi:hypothetical protein
MGSKAAFPWGALYDRQFLWEKESQMVAMRKVAVLLALLAAASIGSGVAQAQVTGLLTCAATAVPPVVRAEGIAELVGDVVLVCQGTNAPVAPAPSFVVNVSISLNVNVTNNINFGAGSNVTDAVLIVNENNCAAPSNIGSTFEPFCGATSPFVQVPQFGVLAADNRLEWNQVSFPYPGADVDGAGPSIEIFPLITTMRISSVRANASQLGVPNAATFPSTQITAFLSITGPTTIAVTNNVLNVAVPILGLITSGSTAITGLQCIDTEATASISLKEGFATAFKTQGVPTFQPGNTQWESGYYAPGSNNGGGASQGTRFLIRFYNIPQGVSIEVPKVVDNGTLAVNGDALRIEWVSGADSNGAGGTLPHASDSLSIGLSGGFGSVTYEVIDDNPFLIETISVPITVTWEADTSNDLPAVGSGQVSASFAPLSTIVKASGPAPEPRFLENTATPRTFITIARCTTTLLFPFVTNQAGFDTGMAISNTSADWLGTDPQTGACTIHYHGATTGGGAAPPEQTSTPIAGGEQLIFTLSGGNNAQNIAGAPEFQGYIIAVCEFQYAHGFAFITDGFGGIPALAQGYLALVIPVTPSGRIPGVPGLHELGESLSH